jgi:hypothetical protein
VGTRKTWAPIAVLAFGFWLRLISMRNDSLFVDELGEAAQHIGRSVAYNLIDFRISSQLLHILLTMPMAYVGWEPFLLRWTSLCVGMVSIAFAYQLGKQLFGSQVALLISAMFSVLPSAVFTSGEIRGYSLMILFSLTSSIALIQALKSKDIRQWLLFALWVTLAAYTHVFSLVLLAPVFLYVVGWISYGPKRLSPLDRAKLSRGAVLALVVISIGIVGLAGLMFNSQAEGDNLQQVGGVWSTDFAPFQLSDLKETFADYLEPLRIANFTQLHGWPQFSYAAAILVAAIASIMEKRHRWAIWYLLLVAIVPMISVTVMLTAIQFHVLARYLDFSLFSYVFLAAYGIWWLSSKGRRNSRAIRLGLGTLLTGIIVLPAYGDLATRYSVGETQQLVKVAHYLQEHASPDDLIFCVARDGSQVTVEKDECLLTMHFYPQLADRTLAWTEMNDYRIWQNFMIPERRCASQYIHWPHPRLGISCTDGKQNGPNVWLVFWHWRALDVPYAWDSPLAQTQFENTRLIHISQSEVLSDNLKQAGELIRSDNVSPERAARNALALAHMYASLADTSRANLLLEPVSDVVTKDDLAHQAQTLQHYLPYLGGTALPEVNSRATWGNQIQLRGYSVHSSVASDGMYDIAVTMFWQITQPPQKDYTFFLHWRDESNMNLEQMDFRPYDGLMPTMQWLPGEIIRETRTLHVPMPDSGKTYKLVIGIYDLETLERLPLENDSSHENVLELGTWP